MTEQTSHDVQRMLERIDALDIHATKQHKMFDVDQEIQAVESNLVSLRRMLRQHHDVKQIVVTQQDGQFQLGAKISSLIQQLKRLREYRAELEAMPDEESDTPARNGPEGDAQTLH